MSEISLINTRPASVAPKASARGPAVVSAPQTSPAIAERPVPSKPDAGMDPVELRSTRLVEALADFQKSIDRKLEIRFDEDHGRTIVTVLDGETQDVSRQIPAEEVLRTIEALETTRSLIFDAEI